MLDKDQKLLIQNDYKYVGKKVYGRTTLNDYVKQKPNKKLLFVIPFQLYLYDMSKKDLLGVFSDFYDYPKESRSQSLLDSLYKEYNVPQYVGKSEKAARFFYTAGEAPSVINPSETKLSANTLRVFFKKKGYRHTSVAYEILPVHQAFNSDKKGKIKYLIDAGKPTIIDSYDLQIPDSNIAKIIEQYDKKSRITVGKNVDEFELKNELERNEGVLRNNGYFKFNSFKDRMYYLSDTTKDVYRIPITLVITPYDSLNNTYPINHIGKITTKVFPKSEKNFDCKYSEFLNNPEGYLCNRLYNRRGLKFIKDTLVSLRTQMGKTNFESNQEQILENLFQYLDKVGSKKKYTEFKDVVMINAQTIKFGNIYRDIDDSNTKRNYYLLDNFDLKKVEATNKKDSINYEIQLVPKDKHQLELLTELNYSEFLSVGTTIGLKDYRRNIFRGAENLSSSLSLTLGTVNDNDDKNHFFNAYDISFQTSLKFPRWVFFKKLGTTHFKDYSPSSSIDAGVSLQNNIGLGRVNYNTQLNYFLQPSDLTTHKLSLFNTQYTRYLNPQVYYDGRTKDLEYINKFLQDYYVYNPPIVDSVNSGLITQYQLVDRIFQKEPNFLNHLQYSDPDLRTQMLYVYRNKQINTQNVLINSILYSYNYNQNRDPLNDNPINILLKLELGGNLLALASNIFSKPDTHKPYEIFGVPFSQFAKIDLDVRKQFLLAYRSKMVLRGFFGLGIPFGNLPYLPYDRNYIAGGANDVRAWRPFSLGPGDSKDSFSLGGFDNLKLLANIEWRFPILSQVDGALFTDIGNVWGTDKDYQYVFKFKEFYKQFGIGSGIGFRYNFGFLTLRLDWAIKIYDPQYDLGDRWNFGRIAYGGGIFSQSRIVFGIGYPF